MIRFVDIRGQGTGYRFAFWDTTQDRFYEFSGDQAWGDADDFMLSFDGDPALLKRLRDLMPDWAKEPAAEDDPL